MNYINSSRTASLALLSVAVGGALNAQPNLAPNLVRFGEKTHVVAACGGKSGHVPSLVELGTVRGESARRLTMHDDGQGDDSKAGDGIYSAGFELDATSLAPYRFVCDYAGESNAPAGEAQSFGLVHVTGQGLSELAQPREGMAPLTVNFGSALGFGQAKAVRWIWDFDGDGVVDVSTTVYKKYSRTFTKPGVYYARAEVVDAAGNHWIRTVPILVYDRVPSVRLQVGNSEVPGEVQATAVGEDPAWKLYQFEWDFDGDGRTDLVGNSPAVSHRYDKPGNYKLHVVARDVSGLYRVSGTRWIAVSETGRTASAELTFKSPQGSLFHRGPFAARFEVAPPRSGSVIRWDWDFDGTGKFDLSTKVPVASHRYQSGGAHEALVRAVFADGRMASATVAVLVSPDVVLKVAPDTLRMPDSIQVQSHLNVAAGVNLYLLDANGTKVRTLVSGVNRDIGDYSDTWDGTDDSRAPVPDGAYFAILEYTSGGQTTRLDLTNSTGGDLYGPAWTASVPGQDNCFNCPFSPFKGDYLTVLFDLPRASQVTAAVVGYWTWYPYATLTKDRYLGSGTRQVLLWDGTDDTGRIAKLKPDDPQFIFSLSAYTLPDNGVVVSNGPQITELKCNANLYNASGRDFINSGNRTAQMTFALSRDASIEASVTSVTTGRELRKMRLDTVTAGYQTVIWDGKTNDGIFVDSGDYRIALVAIDVAGSRSLVRYVPIRVFH